METKTASSRMFSLIVLFDMHTGFFANALHGISDKEAHNRLNTKANHIAWLTGSIVQQRYEIASLLGESKKQAADELFARNKGIQDDITYPTLDSFKNDWQSITPLLRNALVEANDEKLDEVLDMGGMKMTYFDFITFIIYREANIIGQLALWRRLLGYEAMKYM